MLGFVKRQAIYITLTIIDKKAEDEYNKKHKIKITGADFI